MKLAPIITPEIGKLLKARRRAIKLTQEAFGRCLGVSQAAISKAEAGDQDWPIRPIEAYAKALRLNALGLALKGEAELARAFMAELEQYDETHE